MADVDIPYPTLILPNNWKSGDPIPTYVWDWWPGKLTKLKNPQHHINIIVHWELAVALILDSMWDTWRSGQGIGGDRNIFDDEMRRWYLVLDSLTALRMAIRRQDDDDTDDDEDMGRQFRPLGCLHMLTSS